MVGHLVMVPALLLLLAQSSLAGGLLTAKHSKQIGAEQEGIISDRPRNSAQFPVEYPEIPAQDVTEQEYCTTLRCKQEAEGMMDKMDQTVNPCDDFYKFACGGYLEKTTIPDDRPFISGFSEMENELNEQVRGLFGSPISESDPNPYHLRGLFGSPISKSDPKPYHLVKSLYQSCMNKEVIEERGVAPLLSVMKTMGGWPVLEGPTWNRDGFKWYEMIYRFRDMGYPVDYLIDFKVVLDIKKTSKRLLKLDQPALGLPREDLMNGLEDVAVKAYFTYMKDVAQLLGADQEDAEIQMLEVLKFETELAAMSLPRDKRRVIKNLYHALTIQQLSLIAPDIPWVEYINRILPQKIIQVDDSETVNVNVPSYIDHLSLLLVKTPPHVLANYLMWRAALQSMPFLNEQAEEITLKYLQSKTGQSKLPPRVEKCVKYASKSLKNAVGSLYVKNYFDETSRTAAIDMVSKIRNQFYKSLEKIDWMDEVTKDYAMIKARGMYAHIGYPSELLDMKKLEERYKGLELSEGDYFGNSLRMIIFGTEHRYSKLRKEVNKTDWISHGRPALINAGYEPSENSIFFPAAFLQGIMFSKDRPMYMNFGAIGWMIGHEITHGFDDKGRQFDKNGNLLDWWRRETKSRFLTKARCIIEQYGNYTIPELDNLPLNGVNTQGENIADNGGTNLAYRAYKSWITRNGPEALLSGVPFSQSQLFWISGAQQWCAKYTPQFLRRKVLAARHPPEMFRVQGPYSNSEEFSEDFKCPAGSKMNPKKKCIVW